MVKIIFILSILFLLWIFELRFTYVKKLGFDFGICIVQISDYHVSPFVSLSRLNNLLLKIKPEVILLTGDIINRDSHDFNRLERFFSILKNNSNLILFVPGNHEFENHEINNVYKIFKEYDVKNLENSYMIYKKVLFSNLPIDEVKSIDYSHSIFMDHFPNVCEKKIGYDLRICGHTHGGQIRIPFVGAIIDHEKNFLPKNQKGLYEKNGILIYIDSGFGTRIPIRIFNRSMITNIGR